MKTPKNVIALSLMALVLATSVSFAKGHVITHSAPIQLSQAKCL